MPPRKPRPQGLDTAPSAASAVRGDTDREARDHTLRAFSRSLPMALLRAREAVMGRFRPMLRDHDLTEQQWRVLRALTTEPEMRAGRLAALSFISMPSLSRILRTLDERGLIARRAEAADQRATLISLTGDGATLIARIAPLSEKTYDEIAAAYGPDSLEALYSLLAELTTRLDATAPTPDGER